MNLVEVATWIQEGYKEYYGIDKLARPILNRSTKDYVMQYVMRKGRGHLNPKVIEDLIKLETSVEDKVGRTLC